MKTAVRLFILIIIIAFFSGCGADSVAPDNFENEYAGKYQIPEDPCSKFAAFGIKLNSDIDGDVKIKFSAETATIEESFILSEICGKPDKYGTYHACNWTGKRDGEIVEFDLTLTGDKGNKIKATGEGIIGDKGNSIELTLRVNLCDETQDETEDKVTKINFEGKKKL